PGGEGLHRTARGLPTQRPRPRRLVARTLRRLQVPQALRVCRRPARRCNSDMSQHRRKKPRSPWRNLVMVVLLVVLVAGLVVFAKLRDRQNVFLYPEERAARHERR